MKVLRKLKLNQLNAEELAQRQMNALRGGFKCGCGCYYEFDGGADVASNYNTNVSSGYSESYGGNVACGDYGGTSNYPTH